MKRLWANISPVYVSVHTPYTFVIQPESKLARKNRHCNILKAVIPNMLWSLHQTAHNIILLLINIQFI